MKILIVRFSSIGDIVLTTPVIRALHEQMQHVEIHYITKKQFASLLNNNPFISKLYTIEKSISEVFNLLQSERYDAVIDLHKNIRTLRLKQILGVKSYSFNKLNFQKWLLVNLKINKMPPIHIVDRYFEAVMPLKVKNNLKNCELFLPSSSNINCNVQFDLTPKNYLAVAIGAQFATKTMPTSILISILSKIKFPIILLGGPSDVERAEIIENELRKHHPKVINAVNKYSLLESASIVQQATAILTHDTGLMHIATAYNIPIISVWGNTVPELGMYPYYPNNPELFSIHEVKNLNCRSCSKIGYKSCPKNHFNCMNLQNVDEIINDINQKINSSKHY